MTKLPAVATFFAAAAILSGCQPYYNNCPIDDQYWTEEYPSTSSSYYPSTSSWETPVVEDGVYVDNSFSDDSYVMDDGYVTEDSTVSDPWTEEYYPSYQTSNRSIFSYTPSSSYSYSYTPSSSYSYPSYSSDDSITYYPPSVSYPSSSWRNRYLGQRRSSPMYYYSPNNSITMPSWQPVYPSYRY